MSDELSLLKYGQWMLEKSNSAKQKKMVEEPIQHQRLLQLAQSMGLKPKKVDSVAFTGSKPNENAFENLPDDPNTIHYDNFFDTTGTRSLRHELAHRMLVPEGKTFKDHSRDLSEKLESGIPEHSKHAWEHENAVMHAEQLINRLAGVKIDPKESDYKLADAHYNSQEYGNNQQYKVSDLRSGKVKLEPHVLESMKTSVNAAKDAMKQHLGGNLKFNAQGIVERKQPKIPIK